MIISSSLVSFREFVPGDQFVPGLSLVRADPPKGGSE